MVTAVQDLEILIRGYPSLPHEVWRRMWGWYRAAVYHAALPSRITLERITAERMELYRAVHPPPPPPPWERIFSHPYRPPKLTTPYLQSRTLSG